MKISKLTLASILFMLILVLWPILAIFSLPEGNNFAEQIESIKNAPLMHILNFIVAFLIAPAIIYMLYEFYKKISNNNWSILAKAGFSLYGIYFIFVNFSYGSQFLYFPFILESGSQSEILTWYFYDNNSLAIFFNQTGYLIWSVATLMVFTQFLFKSTLLFFIVKILSLSALTQIIATIGLYANMPDLTNLSFYSGILLLPAGLLILIYSFKNRPSE